MDERELARTSADEPCVGECKRVQMIAYERGNERRYERSSDERGTDEASASGD
jgi:hypothetical protein